MSKKSEDNLSELKNQSYQQIYDYIKATGVDDRIEGVKSPRKFNGHDRNFHEKHRIKDSEIYFSASRGQAYASNTWDRMTDNLQVIQDLLASKNIESHISCDRQSPHGDPSVILKIDVTQTGFKSNLKRLLSEIGGSTATSNIVLLHNPKTTNQAHAK